MKKTLSVLIPLVLFAVNSFGQADTKKYAVAEHPTPVFTTSDFPDIFGGKDGKTLRTDNCQQIKDLEFIAFPKTAFKIESRISRGKATIFKVTTDDYPNPPAGGLFIDSRFVSTQEKEPRARSRALLKKPTIVENLVSLNGSMYTRGGNYNDGIQKMLSVYPPAAQLSPEAKDRWILKGEDEAGLLYEASNGYSPRSINALIDSGRPVRIAGLNVGQIIEKVEPLDVIAWQNHVIIILDKERAVESRLEHDKKKGSCGGGVKIRPLKEALHEVMSSRSASDKSSDAKSGNKFVIRRWYPESQF